MSERGDSRGSASAPGLSVLYRGPLASCNYGCEYCPFGKRVDDRDALACDAAALARFTAWALARRGPTAVLFTPWGEALIRRPYRDALIALSNAVHVRKAAIQTNLSGPVEWTRECVAARLGIWATYHPGWTDEATFASKVCTLHERGVSVSAGVVGIREHFAAIAALRRRLPADIYMWVNAYKREPGYYTADDIARLRAIDPLFPVNNRRHPSRGHPCDAGHTVIAVDGDGDARRCHFIPEVIGNIYAPDFADRLHPRACDNTTCGCHIGYVHMPALQLRQVFGTALHGGLLERVPAVSRDALARYRLPVLQSGR